MPRHAIEEAALGRRLRHALHGARSASDSLGIARPRDTPQAGEREVSPILRCVPGRAGQSGRRAGSRLQALSLCVVERREGPGILFSDPGPFLFLNQPRQAWCGECRGLWQPAPCLPFKAASTREAWRRSTTDIGTNSTCSARERTGWLCRLRGQIGRVDHKPLSVIMQAFPRTFSQLADIARPAVARQHCFGPAGQPLDGLGVLLGEPVEEVAFQQGADLRSVRPGDGSLISIIERR